MKKILFIISLIFILSANFAVAQPAQNPVTPPASDPYGLTDTAQEAGLISQNTTPLTVSQIIGMIINAFLGLVGVIYLVLIIYSGVVWMTAGGNEETITKAKKKLVNATIGLILIFTAFIITNYIVFKILDITVPPT